MKTVDISHPLLHVKEYLAIPPDKREEWLEAQEWFQSLPDDHQYSCQHCQDTGTILDDNNQARDCWCAHTAARTPQWQAKNQYILLDEALRRDGWDDRSGWPVPTFDELQARDDFTSTKPFEAGKRLIEALKDGRRPVLWLIGSSGRGKTLSALQVLSWGAYGGLRGMAFRWREIIGWTARGTQQDGEFQNLLAQRIKLIGSLDIALIDDVGKGDSSNKEQPTKLLGEIAEERRKCCLILTSNLTEKQLIGSKGQPGYLDPAALSRLFADGERVCDYGTDLRIQGRMF